MHLTRKTNFDIIFFLKYILIVTNSNLEVSILIFLKSKLTCMITVSKIYASSTLEEFKNKSPQT